MTATSTPALCLRTFTHANLGHPRVTEWEAAQRRMRITEDGRSVLYLPVKVNYRYWISSIRDHGRIHIATGRAIRTVNHTAWPDQIIIQPHCGGSVYYPRGIDSPDAAPGFTLCPRCVIAEPKEG